MPSRSRGSPESPLSTSRRIALSNLGRLLPFTPSKRTRAFSAPSSTTTSPLVQTSDSESHTLPLPPTSPSAVQLPRSAGVKRVRSECDSQNGDDSIDSIQQLTPLPTVVSPICPTPPSPSIPDVQTHLASFETKNPSQEAIRSRRAACRMPPIASESAYTNSQLQQMSQDLSQQIFELHTSHEAQQKLLQESLNEQARATALLESRLDMLQAQTLQPRPPSSPTSTLILTVLDALSYILLCLINLFIARPYSLFKKLMGSRTMAGEDIGLKKCRKSWRLSAADCLDDPFFSGAAMRISLGGAARED